MQARIGAGVAAVVVLGAVIWIVAASTGGGRGAGRRRPAPARRLRVGQRLRRTTADPSPATPRRRRRCRGHQGRRHAADRRAALRLPGLHLRDQPRRDQGRVDLSKTPCTAASIAYLASRGSTTTPRATGSSPAIFALQCGDPAGTGAGGATYRFADENLPKDKLPAYHEGDVAMANTGPARHQRQPVLLRLGRHAAAGRLQPVGPGHRGPRHRQAGRLRPATTAPSRPQAGGGHPNQPFTFTKVTAGPITDTPARRTKSRHRASAASPRPRPGRQPPRSRQPSTRRNQAPEVTR